MNTVNNAKELVDQVTAFIAQGNPQLAAEAQHELITQLAEHASIEHAQSAVNRYWRMQLAVLPMSTFSIRECLLDDQPVVGWLRNFRDQVAPFIIQNVKK